ncbi:hypothetical protein AAKU67_001593 [Oxalobacteraceae bacterium GrIS 2.11]
MTNREPKLQSQALINEAMKIYRGESYVEPPKNIIDSGSCHTLSRQQSVQGVIALVHALNLTGGSGGDVDLYKLNYGYLTNPEVRAQINSILRQYGI